jgi:hypothetical protein
LVWLKKPLQRPFEARRSPCLGGHDTILGARQLAGFAPLRTTVDDGDMLPSFQFGIPALVKQIMDQMMLTGSPNRIDQHLSVAILYKPDKLRIKKIAVLILYYIMKYIIL